MSLLSFVQTVAAFIVGPFGISLITLAIGFRAARAALGRGHWEGVGEAILAGAVLFSAGWIVQTWLA